MKALIVVDVQYDFCSGGALAVGDADVIVEPINQFMSQFESVILTQDWHPQDHSSFASQHNAQPMTVVQMPYGAQVLWPDHCVQGQKGAEFHHSLNVHRAEMIVRKGFNRDIDSYSAFFENDKTTPTGLEGYLKTRHITDLTFVGLATDFCVAYSAIDAARLGFHVSVELGLTRAIDLDGSLASSIQTMEQSGVKVIE